MACRTRSEWVRLTAVICSALLIPGDLVSGQQAQSPQPKPTAQVSASIPAEQLDQPGGSDRALSRSFACSGASRFHLSAGDRTAQPVVGKA